MKRLAIYLSVVSLAILAAITLPRAWARQHPSPPGRYSLHIVKAGESPWGIMADKLPDVDTRLAITWLEEANGLEKGYVLQPGDVLNVPDYDGPLTEPVGPEYSSEEAAIEANKEWERAIKESQKARRELLQTPIHEASRGGDGVKRRYRETVMTATAYSINNRTYSGLWVDQGAIAVDPGVIPPGTTLWVEGYGYGVALDTGSAIKGARLDVFFHDRRKALEWGVKQVKVRIFEQKP